MILETMQSSSKLPALFKVTYRPPYSAQLEQLAKLDGSSNSIVVAAVLVLYLYH